MKKAMKLALEALEDTVDHTEIGSGPNKKAITALREALAEQPAQHEPDWLDKEQAETDWDHVWLLIKAASYASSRGFISGTTNWGSAVSRYMRNESPQPAQPQQEPDELRHIGEQDCLLDVDEEAWRSLVENRGGCRCHISPPCGACSNPISEEEMNEVGYTYTPPPAQRKPLTDEQLVEVVYNCGMNGLSIHGYSFAIAIEAAHGIKENT